ncbi:hypothetical protein AOLI_G00102420, partial [Acnodon oligacanthus]
LLFLLLLLLLHRSGSFIRERALTAGRAEQVLHARFNGGLISAPSHRTAPRARTHTHIHTHTHTHGRRREASVLLMAMRTLALLLLLHVVASAAFPTTPAGRTESSRQLTEERPL